MSNKETVAVLGASDNPARTSYTAIQRLLSAGHEVYPVNPALQNISGLKVYQSLSEIPVSIDTITVYLSEKRSTPLIDEILNVSPRRIILNPGAENDGLKSRAERAGLNVEEACTLVLVGTGQF